MKIRTGFVSNSSSSSFVAWGVDKDEITFSDSYYLEIFNAELSRLKEMKQNDNTSFKRWYEVKYNEMAELENDEEKIEYAKDNLSEDMDYYLNGFENGGQENNFVGLTVGWLMDNHPELTFGEVTAFVAEQLNKTFGTNFTKHDISYDEEGWFDG
jgi:hypothetical protein